MKKGDIVVFVLVFLLGISFVVFNVMNQNTSQPKVHITQFGELKYVLDLHMDEVIRVERGNDYNEVHIEGGRVWVESANCSNQVCVHSMPIQYPGQSLVCLPHQMVVEIIGGKERKIDGVSE